MKIEKIIMKLKFITMTSDLFIITEICDKMYFK